MGDSTLKYDNSRSKLYEVLLTQNKTKKEKVKQNESDSKGGIPRGRRN